VGLVDEDHQARPTRGEAPDTLDDADPQFPFIDAPVGLADLGENRLPEGAGLRYGKGTPIRSFRLGTHYHTPPLNAAGEHAAMAMYSGTEPKYAVCDEDGPRLIAMDGLFAGKPAD
jgi:hypothetical protein